MKSYKTLAPAELVTGNGRPLPKRLGREITREIDRLARKLAIALWRYVELGLVPEGAVVK